MTWMTHLTRGSHTASVRYVLIDRLQRHGAVCVTADEISATVSDWLAQLGAHSPLVEEFELTVRKGDWCTARAIAERLSVDVAVAA